MTYVEHVTVKELKPSDTINVNDRIFFMWNDRCYSAVCCYLHNIGQQGPHDTIQACLFDNCVSKRILDKNIQISNFQDSELYEWLHTDFLKGFKIDMLDRIADVTIPKVSDIFYRSDDPLIYNLFYPDTRIIREPLDIMDDPKNKIAFYETSMSNYWLNDCYESRLKDDTSFFGEGGFGLLSAKPDSIKGVRPMLILRQN